MDATVTVTSLWQWTWSRVEGAPAGASVVNKWATREYAGSDERRDNYRLRSAVDALMTRGLRDGVFVLRVHDGQRFWRVPPEAFNGWLDGMDLESTWACGRLFDFDATDRYRPLANMELPLLMTEPEAEAFRALVEGQIAHAEDALTPPEPVPEEHVAAWVQTWARRRHWPLGEAIYWVATRDLAEAARLALSSFWAGCGDLGLVGPVLAKIDVDGHRAWRRIVEPEPATSLLVALRDDERLVSYGLHEGDGPMKPISPLTWTRLEFGVTPPGQRDRSDAHKSAANVVGQLRGVRWRDHWTGIVVDRESLMTVFPPTPVEAATPGDDERSDLTDDEWLCEFRNRKRWNAAEVTAWIGARRGTVLARAFGPAGDFFPTLTITEESRLRHVAEIFLDGHVPDTVEPDPRSAIEYAVQRGALRAIGVQEGGHATHRLERLLHHEFWRDDVLALFPELGLAPAEDDSDEAVDAAIRQLSEDRGGVPLPRNDGAKILHQMFPRRRVSHLRRRIVAVFPTATPGPKGPRKRTA